MTFDMEPLECLTDATTYRIIDQWFGRGVAEKLLLYKPPDEVSVVERIPGTAPSNVDRRTHLEHGRGLYSGVS